MTTDIIQAGPIIGTLTLLSDYPEIVFGGAMLSVFLVFATFVVSLCTFLYKWATSSSK